MVSWTIKKMRGGLEYSLTTKISLENPVATASKKEIGPISLTFEIPMFKISNVTIKSLKVETKSKKGQPQKWVRYLTQAGSYVCRT